MPCEDLTYNISVFWLIPSHNDIDDAQVLEHTG